MKRRLEPVDLMVAVGVFATVLGGYFIFISANGTLEAAASQTDSAAQLVSPLDAMQWVQPALGQAIVEDYLLERQEQRDMAKAAMALSRALLTGQRVQFTPFELVERVGMYETSLEADHAIRVQYVLGRTIVNFTTRGVKNGLLSPAQLDGGYNRRMIRLAELNAGRMEEDYQRLHQSLLGWQIVATSLAHDQLASQVQQRMGEAIAAFTLVQDGYREARAGTQEQLAAVTIASIHHEQVADRFDHLASADALTRPGETVPMTQPRSWPEVPVGFLFAASALLVGLFLAGLLTPSVEHEPVFVAEGQAEAAGGTYRKTA
ncbi:MAG: hypothetical protein AB1411_01560 [Nitrospirota bacterium]